MSNVWVDPIIPSCISVFTSANRMRRSSSGSCWIGCTQKSTEGPLFAGRWRSLMRSTPGLGVSYILFFHRQTQFDKFLIIKCVKIKTSRWRLLHCSWVIITDSVNHCNCTLNKTIRLSEESAAMWKKHLEQDDSKIVGEENMSGHFFRGPFMVTTDSCHRSSCADLFSGQLRSSLNCSVCSHYSNTFDVFCDLSLPIPKRGSTGEVSLRDCLDFFSQEEKLDKENSPVCIFSSLLWWYCFKSRQQWERGYKWNNESQNHMLWHRHIIT